MRIRNNLKGTKGFLTAYELALRWNHMRNQKEVARRAKVLTFWSEHGLNASMDALRVSRRTLYRWKLITQERER